MNGEIDQLFYVLCAKREEEERGARIEESEREREGDESGIHAKAKGGKREKRGRGSRW